MIYNKRIVAVCLSLVFVILIGIISIPNDNSIFTSAKASNLPRIILDAGHGGLTNTTH